MLKEQIDGDIVIYASYQLGRTLLEHDLIDEFRLFLYPVVGRGRRAPVREDDRKRRRSACSATHPLVTSFGC